MSRRYLLLFAQEYVEFRYAEIESILKVFNINLQVPKVKPKERPFWILEDVDEKTIRQIASRSVSLKFAAELWTIGETLQEFHENTRNYVQFIDKSYQNQSFKVMVESYNKHLKLPQRIEKIETLSYMDTALGPIDLKTPANKFVYFEYYGLKENLPELQTICFGKWIADGQREMIKSLSLKERKFIGNTSMEAQLSLLMANQGLCKENDIMFDPFVGTGSLLISAATFGSYVMGCDIDYLTLHAKSKPVRAWQKVREKDESIRANMQQYNLMHKFLDVFVGDFSSCPLHENLKFDAIVCDPPYGVRESMSKIEKKERKVTVMTEDAIHYPSLTSYNITNLFNDLLIFAVSRLRMRGRLVMWFPIPDAQYDESVLPQHTALKIIANSKQQLIGSTSRVLVTYEKISENGEIVPIDDLDFRTKYFAQYEARKEQKKAEMQRNAEEAEKRGNKIFTKTEYLQYLNKKRHEEGK